MLVEQRYYAQNAYTPQKAKAILGYQYRAGMELNDSQHLYREEDGFSTEKLQAPEATKKAKSSN